MTRDTTSAKGEPGGWKALLIPTLASVVVTILALWLEYRSGLFQQAHPLSGAIRGITHLLIWLGSFVFLLACYKLVKFSLASHIHVREEVAATAAVALVALSVVVAATLVVQVTPWALAFAVVDRFKSPTALVVLGEPQWSEFALIILTALFIGTAIALRYTLWHGAVSEEEWELNERKEGLRLGIRR